MQFLPQSILELVESLKALPGVGQKTAERYAFFLLRSNPILSEKIAKNLNEIKSGFLLCKECQNYSDTEICPICSNHSRSNEIICVVAEPLDILAFESVNFFDGKYHILHGLIKPIDGISPGDLKIDELLDRVSLGGVKEIILALDTDLPGEATAVYIAGQLKEFDLKITKLAQGLPQGGEIGYTDTETLSRALRARSEF